MIKLQTSLIWPGCAQGKYIVRAKGFILAILRWGNAVGPLDSWSPIAYVPIDPAGNGEYFFSGRRAIPRNATHLWAHCVSSDFSHFEDAFAIIPERFLAAAEEGTEIGQFSVLTDLHLAAKPWMIKRALQAAEAEIILLLGDSTNDGSSEQFSQFQSCISEASPDKIILCVPGNHDVTPPKRVPAGVDGMSNYTAFHNELMVKLEQRGLPIHLAPNRLTFSTQFL